MTRSTLERVAVATAIVALPLIGCHGKRDMQRYEQRSAMAVPADKLDWGYIGGEPIGGGPVDVSIARAKIVDARCEREASCGFISENSKWASKDACHEVVKAEYSDDLTADDCANGVDAKQLTQCVSDSRTTDCSQSVDVIGRVPSCRNSKLCSR